MNIKSWLDKLRGTSPLTEKYSLDADFEGLNFFTTSEVQAKIASGQASGWITHQHIALSMLTEQGDAEKIPNGFIVPTEVAVQLGDEDREILELPPKWQGKIKAEIKGTTSGSSFSVNLSVETPGSNFSRSYKIIGPILRFTEQQQFLLTPAQQLIFGAHQAHGQSEKTEYDNLKLMLALQKAQSFGAQISLGSFNKLNVKAPDAISIEIELDAQGNLILTPFMGQDASNERINRVLGQLHSTQASALRVDDEIILFDEKKLKAVHEILKNRTIPKRSIKEFLSSPSAFIDASQVDLDLGFSARVKGATLFKHAYFGETDNSGIDWFGRSLAEDSIYPFGKITEQVEDKATLHEVKVDVENAQKTGAQLFEFQGKTYDISSSEAVSDTLEKLEQKVARESDWSGEDDISDNKTSSPTKPEIVVDIDLNDEILSHASPQLAKEIAEVLYPGKLSWDNYARHPFPHQLTGVQWIVGLAQQHAGGLLADDMGLGKTFMALSAIDHLYKLQPSQTTKKPALIIAPLSLLENWKDEVEKTFTESPFKSIVLLQSAADLNRYRTGGNETKSLKHNLTDEAQPQYSLHVGSNFGANRLDLPERLVITTYQTLRDYQFSLCKIDWSIVVFDEAQNIKNPNTLQTRAAKGLKADFKLVATGTPVENSLADFWCLMDTCCPGHLHHYQDFREKYITPIVRAAGDEVGDLRDRIGRELRLAVGPLMLRRLKEDNLEGLPKKNLYVGIQNDKWAFHNLLYGKMAGYQLDNYNATLEVPREGNQVLGSLQRLRDISLHPRLADKGLLHVPDKIQEVQSLFNESAKMLSLIATLEEVRQRNEKCIIFAVNKHLQQFLSHALRIRFGLQPIPLINGDTKAISKRDAGETRKALITAFEASPGFNIIIMSPVAAGVGLTVVGANNVIHFERHWNPAKEAQATDRVYRIGQRKDVNIYVPILHHPTLESFDANLHRLLSKKTLLKDAVITPEEVIPTPAGFGGDSLGSHHQLSADDLLKISWEQFEALGCLLAARHFKAHQKWLTKTGADFGADAVILTTQLEGALIQCKHTKNMSYDGYKAITEIHSARIKYENALGKQFPALFFMTNAKQLSTRARSIAQEYEVEIIDHSQISQWLESHPVTLKDILILLNSKRVDVTNAEMKNS